ncbi:MAG: TetR/AcrR family transcriptional regulator [Anaerotignum sp.]|nr:TetR/AcrR family transcriptional regulator [Anaerotignum sp.]
MAQVLKDEIRERIYEAALDVFFQKDFKSATMREIAKKAGVPTGLTYSYFKNKEVLFDEIIRPVLLKFPDTLKQAEEAPGQAFDKFVTIEREFFLGLFVRHREFIILMDKSAGTSHSDAKENMIHLIEEHIRIGLKKRSNKEYDDLLAHILASNFTECVLEIARHYKSREWAEEMLHLVSRQHFFGSNSL